MPSHTWGAVVVAAGRGTRFGRPKQLLETAGRPLVAWSVNVFASMPEVTSIVVTTEAQWLEEMRDALAPYAPDALVIRGGATRQQSVGEGLRALGESVDAVLVHDGARPLVTPELVRAGMQPVSPGNASLLALPVVDTIKVVPPGDSLVTQTPDRATLWAAQTPQFAMLADMRAAHDAGIRSGLEATDDAMLLEVHGVRVHVVRGAAENFKVTLPHDLERAAHLLRMRVSCA